MLAKDTLDAGPRTFGIISAAFGAGALVGALSAAMMATTRWRVMFIGAAGFGLCELVLAPLHSVALAGVVLFVCGVFFTSYSANSNTAIQLASPDYIRGRVLGLYYYAWNGLAPFGALLVGFMCDRGGTELAFYVGGAMRARHDGARSSRGEDAASACFGPAAGRARAQTPRCLD